MQKNKEEVKIFTSSDNGLSCEVGTQGWLVIKDIFTKQKISIGCKDGWRMELLEKAIKESKEISREIRK